MVNRFADKAAAEKFTDNVLAILCNCQDGRMALSSMITRLREEYGWRNICIKRLDEQMGLFECCGFKIDCTETKRGLPGPRFVTL